MRVGRFFLTSGLFVGVAAALSPATTTASTPPDASGHDAAGSIGDEFEPVTIEHRYGSTEVAERPERIVSLDGQWTDTLVALGTPPVGHAVDSGIEGDFPWLGDELADSTGIDTLDGIPYEAVAALEPDLIVISWAATDEAVYEDLAAIAPTITSLSDAVVDPWQSITTAAGQILGTGDEAARLIDDVEQQVAGVASELPGLAGQTFAFANYIPGDQIYVLTDPADGAVGFFTSLGLELPGAIAGAEAPPGGRYEISFEQIGLLDADVVVMLTGGVDPSQIVGFDQLGAVRNGSSVVLDYAAAVALNVPSALSIPYGLDAVRPALEAAAAT